MKFLKSKFFIICLSVAIVVTIVPTVLSAMGHTGFVRNAIVSVTYPVRWLFNTVSDGLHGFSEYFTRFEELKEENESLRQELDKAKDKLDEAEIALEENKWLKEYFGIADDELDMVLLDASVVGYETGNAQNVFTLDRGSLNGVKKNMPVITADGLVGKVTEVGLNWCKIITVLEDSVSAGAYVERTRDHGLMTGDYGLMHDGVCKMTGIPATSDVKVGDRVLTSGLGSIYPKGIPIGCVASVLEDPETHTLTVTVTPYVDLGAIERVMIITDSSTVITLPETSVPETSAYVNRRDEYEL
ncbi:MAG: rod shape-determining protein MreC [Clostridia bacterium]|nr:rod shape-determining protein MreC [Clostridia bacterium]